MAFSQAFTSFEAFRPLQVPSDVLHTVLPAHLQGFCNFFGGLAGPASRQGEARGDSETKGGEGG